MSDLLGQRPKRHDHESLPIFVSAGVELELRITAEDVVESNFCSPVQDVADYAAAVAPEFSTTVNVGKEFRYSVKVKDVVAAPHIDIALFIRPSRFSRGNRCEAAVKKTIRPSISSISSASSALRSIRSW